MELLRYSNMGGRLDNLTPTSVYEVLYGEKKDNTSLCVLEGENSESKDCSNLC